MSANFLSIIDDLNSVKRVYLSFPNENTAHAEGVVGLFSKTVGSAIIFATFVFET